MTIAIWILVEIILVILLGGVEVLQGQFLYRQRLIAVLLLLGNDIMHGSYDVRCMSEEGAFELNAPSFINST